MQTEFPLLDALININRNFFIKWKQTITAILAIESKNKRHWKVLELEKLNSTQMETILFLISQFFLQNY